MVAKIQLVPGIQEKSAATKWIKYVKRKSIQGCKKDLQFNRHWRRIEVLRQKNVAAFRHDHT